MFIKPSVLESLRQQYPVGARVILVKMDDKFSPPYLDIPLPFRTFAVHNAGLVKVDCLLAVIKGALRSVANGLDIVQQFADIFAVNNRRRC